MLLEHERAGIADVSHRLRTPMTALRLRIDALADPGDRARLGEELDRLQARSTPSCARRGASERQGLTGVVDGVAMLAGRVPWWAPLAEDQGRPFEVRLEVAGPVPVRAGADDLVALVDVLLDNVFTHTPDDAAVRVTLDRDGAGCAWWSRTPVRGCPTASTSTDRGASGGGSTGLGLSIARRTAEESGGRLALGGSDDLGGASVDGRCSARAMPATAQATVSDVPHAVRVPTRLAVNENVSLPGGAAHEPLDIDVAVALGGAHHVGHRAALVADDDAPLRAGGEPVEVDGDVVAAVLAVDRQLVAAAAAGAGAVDVGLRPVRRRAAARPARRRGRWRRSGR